jgi:PEP-CTERM motif
MFLGSQTRGAKLILIAVGIAALPAIVPANAGGITRPAGLKDTIDWAQLGVAGFEFPSPQTVVSADGVTATATNSAGGFFNRIDQHDHVNNGDWFGNFAPGEALVENFSSGSEITLTFATPVLAAGAPIQSNALGPFTAQVTVNGTETFTEDGDSTQKGDGSAIFIGWSGGPIRTLEFEITAASSGGGGTSDFAIGTVSLTSVPEPSTWAMMVIGFAGLGYVGYRASRRAAAATA